MLRVGIAGLGVTARQVAPAVARFPGVELAAVADVRPEAVDEFRQRFDVRAFASAEEMCVSRDVDVVWIATPNPLHARHAVAAAENGKHIISEKPMAASL